MTGSLNWISNRRFWVLTLFLLVMRLGTQAQCANNNTQTGSAITVPCPGTYSPAPCVRGGRYVVVNVTAGNTYTFATCGSTAFDTYMTVYTSGGTLVGYNDDACGTQSVVTWTAAFTGQVRVLLDRGAGCNGTNNGTCAALNISCANSVPANDLICNATTLPVGASCTNITPSPTNSLATTTAGPPAPGCANYNGGDVWFKLTVPLGGAVTINSSAISTSPLYDLGLAAYSSSNNTCSGVLTLLACNDDINFPYNQMSYLSLSGLTVGSTIFIRAWENGNDAAGPFDICATSTPPLPNEPCSALSVPVGVDCDYQPVTNVGATRTTTVGNPGCNFTNAVKDVWYSFTAPSNGKAVIQSITGTLTDGGMALYSSTSGTCAGPFTLITCDDDNGAGLMPFISTTTLVPGATYWLRFWGYSGQTGTFSLCIFSPTGTRVEDCVGGHTVCDNQQITNTSVFTGFTSDLTAINQGCLSSSERQGTWYIFSIASAGDLGFKLTPLANDDYDFAIWGPYGTGSTTGSVCAPSVVPLRCSYASGASTFSATGSYTTGLANASYVTPQFAAATTCATCTENSGGNGWVSGITVTVGEVYLLYVSNFSQSGSAFDLTWDLFNGASLACTVLPVELMGLMGSAQQRSITVQWTTLSEHNSDYFVLERSADAQNFQPIGTVEAAGESQHRIDYTFIDNSPLTGANYYRLKQVDLNGAYERTPAVVVLFGKDQPAATVFPNPASDAVNVAFEMPADGTAYLQLLDLNGRVVRDRDMDMEKGPRTLSLRVQDLQAGTYDLRLITTTNGGIQNLRFIKD